MMEHKFDKSLDQISGNPRTGKPGAEHCPACGAWDTFREVYIIGKKNYYEADLIGGHTYVAREAMENIPAKACNSCGVVRVK